MNEYKIYMSISAFIIIVSLILAVKILQNSADLIYIASSQKIPVEITNNGTKTVFINDEILKPGNTKNLIIGKNEKFIIKDNYGIITVKTYDKIYKIKLKKFEVVVEDGKN
ncbi:hypothetical protein XO10_01290 [Marinitoga sp. 1135]|uniref:Uncharacterized protein n=1 Tax=Marinitoga piezophila (strain DSM 14283 / JCM 11233 / KA3) TaxID=443254 RepID=H2J3K7_MARPK|nr:MULTISPECIES: hypothetical protein [Marinitoga]AEX84651.1 hypothetical protein Marpi_0196 [Marinitoga piezophila KA3]APT75166.1 hypothetical protein LN42_01205 [Marinitoga sp. 1137]NUU94940.1 hypothetical protein [Marinitoga sp. 1135]NUU96893.1 hypothetical protein [Marinitoga sp. 1138]